MSALWHLPGPSHLLSLVTDALHAGRHVVLQWPTYAPALGDFHIALSHVLHDVDVPFTRVSAPSEVEPLMWLADYFELSHEHPLSIPSLLHHTEFRGRVHWVDVHDTAARESWLEFTRRLASYTDHVSAIERPLIVLPLPEPRGTVTDAGVALLGWDGHYDEHDATMLASTLLRPHFHGATRALLASMAAQVALFDVQLLRTLVLQDLSVQLDPTALLLSEAQERGWTEESVRDSRTGTVAWFGGQERMHSALKVLCGGIKRRIWRAQASVLLLYLEEARQNLIDRYERHLQLPFDTQYGQITHPQDLELSHLHFQAKTYFPRVAGADVARLKQLKGARHALAHLSPIPPASVRLLLGT